ncbi:MAG: hypothetical protein A2Z91_07880 [Deltaproteobacteria bacterium GWA2_38_16]|nr:MAG: hypothetical protein A2Z91_07880 [Deltaproteobacteria bacterium GWA2_38_16]OGQ03363.1 MAG: hypothetical protein A3D19_04500 [Deltaproteobacteria bacterium RIFCSPHIGHO2_02_FULL_38_15]OGQ33510.1 MAG: hypothetical protein A3A72_04455 [Deltaproteobacteria bacterium RIFCSPLOWO2_01_FULL_38_9]OGQ59535.1 MAG: hypothetical protein A3G92_04500 [Deltaproteobacteria bacterium RIFCSPLOWO2_12_FULL_38_8]HBQ20636.1 thymidine phosphorylase [Deltaproteobacteria bacterium]
MRAVDIIYKKREGQALTQEEISFLVKGFTSNEIPDYQMSAFLMACFFNPPSFKEATYLTKSMLYSGKIFDFSTIPFPKVDKHSTGGVGDKTSLIIAPIVASYDVAVPMISGRGLGHTGGTLDKLESIPGFNVNLTFQEFEENLKNINVSMMGQTQEIAPADAKMYALRDVTATVECIPLITASIMSKKLAEGTDGLVLDVKFGDGAFIQDFKKACELAQWMVKIGKSFGKKVIALVTNMDQPLGNKVGNSLEVEESIDVLKGQGPKDLEELSLKLSGYMLLLGKVAKSLPEGIKLSQKAIENGKALAKFKTMVKTHGGDESVVDSFTCLPKAAYKQEFLASKNGFIQKIQAKDMGLAAALLGCGRNTITDTVDSSVGFTLHQKVGDKVQKGETLLTIYYNDEKKLAASMAKLNTAYAISQKRPRFQPLIRKVIS